jgi:proton-translocating NADH-quinone oxidoreductase chain M
MHLDHMTSNVISILEIVFNFIYLGLGVHSFGAMGFFWIPIFGIFVLFMFVNFALLKNNYSNSYKIIKNISIVNLFDYFSSIRFLRIFLVFLALLILLVTLLTHSLIISYSFYGLFFFQDILSLHFFGPAQNFTFVLDTFSSFFVLLNAFVIFCCLIFITLNKTYFDLLNIMYRSQLLLLTQFFANLAFMATDILGFYVFYEAVLIPVFFLIGIWGSSQRRIKAAYFFFFFTLISSMPMLIGILHIRELLGSTSYSTVFNYAFLLDCQTQKLIWFYFFISFAFKIPMFPAHIWLPEAHVEAPTEGSMILAGLLLKLGFFGFFKFLLQLFPDVRNEFFDFVVVLALLGVLMASLTALRQTDLKRIIAYSSVVHMNFALLGFCSLTQLGIIGAFTTMFGHAVVSTILFSLIGSLYVRTGTRLLNYYSGLAIVMPIYSTLLFFFSFFNAALPGSLSFIGELYTFLSLTETSLILLFSTFLSFVLNIIYMLWFINRLCFGDLNTNYIKIFRDLSIGEIDFYFSTLLLSLGLGFMPNVLIGNLAYDIFY